jgi:nucleotide-binding universal stress UspA family protein
MTSPSTERHMGADAPTLLVNLETGQSNAGLLQVASSLADRLGATVIGAAARQPMQFDVSGTCYMSPDIINEARAETDAELSSAEAEFRGAFHGADVEWRSTVSYASPSDYIVDQARRADLLITGMPPREAADPTRAAAGDLVMQCGRPVLVVPQAPVTPSLARVMVAWKDRREARRATLDALPLLKRATHVTVVEIAADEDMAAARQRLADISRWLAGHGITAEVIAAVSSGDDAAQLESIAGNSGANLIVAGAYGHSRLREWAFGGVTRTLLQRGDRCAMLSH